MLALASVGADHNDRSQKKYMKNDFFQRGELCRTLGWQSDTPAFVTEAVFDGAILKVRFAAVSTKHSDKYNILYTTRKQVGDREFQGGSKP